MKKTILIGICLLVVSMIVVSGITIKPKKDIELSNGANNLAISKGVGDVGDYALEKGAEQLEKEYRSRAIADLYTEYKKILKLNDTEKINEATEALREINNKK